MKIGHFLFTFRGLLGAAAFIILFIFARPKPALLLGGLMPIGIGLCIRLWARGYIGDQSTGDRPLRLVTNGPYRFIRNPLYGGNFFLVAGVLVAVGLPWFLIIAAFALFIVEYLFIIHYEESLLAKKFPTAYPAYKQSTGMIFPKKTQKAPGGAEGFSVKNLRGEFKTGAALALVYLLLAVKMFFGHPLFCFWKTAL